MVKDITFAKLVITNRIENYLKNNTYDDFISKNSTLNEFIYNFNLSVILSHNNSTITEDDYNEILASIKAKVKVNNTNKSDIDQLMHSSDLEDTIVLPAINENTTEKRYQIAKKISANIKNGFIDAAILAFVTGSVFGALFINLYINILRTLT